MNPKQLLVELEEVLRTQPPVATRRHDRPENHAWLGRAANVIEKWDPSRGPVVRELIKQFQSVMARESGEAYKQIIILLNQAQYDLHARLRILSLKGYRGKLEAQDEILRQSSSIEIPTSVSVMLVNLFSEIGQGFPELNLPSFEIPASREAFRCQIAVAMESISGIIGSDSKGQASNDGSKVSPDKPRNPELVFVIHGRQLLGDFHIFLRSLGLRPLEWSEARRRTGKPNPYTWEIVDLALKEAGAIVALFTPDDEARLREQLWTANENSAEKEFLPQPRQNVLFEAGVAYGRDPRRTILLRVGSHRPMSDLTGHHMVQLNNSPQSRQEVADALRAAGCPVDVSGSDWFRDGNFSLPDDIPNSGAHAEKMKKDAGKLLLYKTHIKGFSDLATAADAVASIHEFFAQEPQYLNESSVAFLQKYPPDFRDNVHYDVTGAEKRWSLQELQLDVERLRID